MLIKKSGKFAFCDSTSSNRLHCKIRPVMEAFDCIISKYELYRRKIDFKIALFRWWPEIKIRGENCFFLCMMTYYSNTIDTKTVSVIWPPETDWKWISRNNNSFLPKWLMLTCWRNYIRTDSIILFCILFVWNRCCGCFERSYSIYPILAISFSYMKMQLSNSR